MEAKITLQKQIAEQLQTMLTNYKKDNEQRKTQEYLESRLTSANEYWTNVETNDQALAIYRQAAKEQPYFKKDFFSSVRNVHLDLTGRIQLKMWQKFKRSETIAQAEGGDDSDTSVSDIGKEERIKEEQSLQTTLMDQITLLEEDPELLRTEGAINIEMELLKTSWNEWRLAAMGSKRKEDQAPEYYEKIYEIVHKRYIMEVGRLQDRMTEMKKVPITIDRGTKVKLPEIKIPEFDGKISKWTNFMQMFNEIVHNNTSIQEATKCTT